ncbi:gas vesicle protein [bacterium]|nr:gas vesicle protein [bacterium]
MTMAIPQLVEKAREDLASLTGLELGSTLGSLRDEKGWRVQVEMVEKKSLPDSMDILATYECLMDEDGNLIEFNRKGMRKRIDMVNPGGEE